MVDHTFINNQQVITDLACYSRRYTSCHWRYISIFIILNSIKCLPFCNSIPPSILRCLFGENILNSVLSIHLFCLFSLYSSANFIPISILLSFAYETSNYLFGKFLLLLFLFVSGLVQPPTGM